MKMVSAAQWLAARNTTDGSEFPAKASISKLDLDGETVFTAILRDISGYKSTEAALEWERTLLRTLMQAWPDLVYVKDRESRFLAANARLAVIMGAESPEEMIGRTDLDYHPPDLAAGFLANEQHLIESGQAVTGCEEAMIGPDGETMWLSTTKGVGAECGGDDRRIVALHYGRHASVVGFPNASSPIVGGGHDELTVRAENCGEYTALVASENMERLRTANLPEARRSIVRRCEDKAVFRVKQG